MVELSVGIEILSWLTLLAGIATVLLIVDVIAMRYGKKKVGWLTATFKENALVLAFIVALTATLGSLYLSEVLKYTPCILCWYQRIFMYPQVILLGLALYTKDKKVWKYSMALAVIGLAIAGGHYLMQIGILQGNCSAVGYSSSCSEFFFLRLGYITIPMMAFTAFIAIIVLGMLADKRNDLPHFR